jgi:hypothetical protein
VIGAGTVGWAYALAARVSRFVWVAPAVGLTLVFYYPLIALGGYFLSETPSSLLLVGSTYFLIRLIDEGGWKHAFLAGLMVALGFTFRPQLVVPVLLFAPFWLIYRKRMPNVTLKRLLVAAAPLLVVAALSSWRMYHHTERFGLISENGPFNQVFGRCHNKSIVALPDGKGHGKTSFGPPAHIQLFKRDQDPKKGWPKLDPALGLEFEFRGYIADREVLSDYIRKCMAKTGPLKQIEYTVVNVLLLWRYNVMWPDSGKPEWVPYARLWALIVVNVFAIPPFFALLALFFPQNWLKLGVVSLQLISLLIVGGMYMGEFRIRTTYDPILLFLAFEVYAVAIALLAALLQRHVMPRLAKRQWPLIR